MRTKAKRTAKKKPAKKAAKKSTKLGITDVRQSRYMDEDLYYGQGNARNRQNGVPEINSAYDGKKRGGMHGEAAT